MAWGELRSDSLSQGSKHHRYPEHATRPQWQVRPPGGQQAALVMTAIIVRLSAWPCIRLALNPGLER